MLKHVFSPVKIGKLEISNRLVVSPMVTDYCNKDGTATERYIAYHETKAKGGWGLIICEDYAVDPKGKGFSNLPGLWNDNQIEGHRELTKRIHKHGTKIIAQIYHCGRQTSHNVIGSQPVAPSPIPCPVMQEIPHELTISEIHDLVEKYGDCALRAKKAGFDGVEVHGAHGYLIAEFMSPYSNKRTDEYGGSLINRMRFPLEIISNIKQKAGNDFLVTFRISGNEFVPGGITMEDTKAIAVLLENAGIHAIHVSAGVYVSIYAIIPPAAVPHGWITDFTAELKKVVHIPVITVGRINNPLFAETIIASGKADLVAMGRASLADPELPKKAAAGKFEEINTCIGCLQGCIGWILQDKPIKCFVNPTLGRENEFAINPAANKKKVLIAGAGPGGVEAAIVAAKRGHEVHLYEKTDRFGGQFRIAAVPPNKGEIASFISWQRNELAKLNVAIYLNTELTVGIVNKEKPDAVIVATGGKPIVPDIPGLKKSSVVSAHDVLTGKVQVGPNVLIIGGGQVGSETADHLANHGKKPTLVEMLPDIANDVVGSVRYFLIKDLKEKDVKVLVDSTVKEVTGDSVIISKGGKEEKIGPFDTIVLAVGVKSENELVSKLQGKVKELVTIGDAMKARKALEAIEEGYKAGLEI